MPRHLKLRKKKIGKSVYWFTKAGGDTYFGSVEETPYKDARRRFNQHLESVVDTQDGRKSHQLTAGELMDVFLDWLEKHRSDRTYSTRKTHYNCFGKFRVKGQKLGDLPARRIRGSDLEAWLAHLEKEGHEAQTRRHAQTSIKHCWNWATKHCPEGSNTPYLPPTFRPFASVERVYVPPKALTEADLITDDEIKALFAAAEIDLDTFHRFGPKNPRPHGENPYRSFAEMLRCYHATGARTDELAQGRVGDVLFKTKQVVLGKHRRSQKQRTPTLMVASSTQPFPWSGCRAKEERGGVHGGVWLGRHARTRRPEPDWPNAVTELAGDGPERRRGRRATWERSWPHGTGSWR